MAHLVPGGFNFTGPLSNLTAYQMRGSDKTIVRTKGGPKAEDIKSAPHFINTRRNIAEFGGRSTATRWIRYALNPLLSLADYNIAGPINALLKPLQQLDTTNDWGKRSILFTKRPDLLQGFQLNKRNPFDQIIRNPVTCSISKQDLTAQVDLPSLIPGINLFVPANYPYLGIVVVLAVLPDLVYDPQGYKPTGNYEPRSVSFEETKWHLSSKGAEAQTIQLKINQSVPDESFSLLLSVGVRFGTPGIEKIEQVKYAGAGKVLAVI